MSYVTGSLIQGWAIVDVLVGVSGPRRSLLQKHKFPIPAAVHMRALIDTGASISGFSSRVFQELSITPVSKLDVLTPSTPPNSPHICDVYDVSLSLVANESPRAFPDARVMVADCWLPNEGIEALLGMDILKFCFFQLMGPEGRFMLALQN
jgi:hypothetical protein